MVVDRSLRRSLPGNQEVEEREREKKRERKRKKKRTGEKKRGKEREREREKEYGYTNDEERKKRERSSRELVRVCAMLIGRQPLRNYARTLTMLMLCWRAVYTTTCTRVETSNISTS